MLKQRDFYKHASCKCVGCDRSSFEEGLRTWIKPFLGWKSFITGWFHSVTTTRWIQGRCDSTEGLLCSVMRQKKSRRPQAQWFWWEMEESLKHAECRTATFWLVGTPSRMVGSRCRSCIAAHQGECLCCSNRKSTLKILVWPALCSVLIQ